MFSQSLFVLCLISSVFSSRLTLPNILPLDDAGNIVLAWEANHDAEEITFEIEANTTGYIGFGISPQGSMLDADIFIAGVGSDLSAYSSDRFGIGFVTPKVDDHQDWILLNAIESDGVTYIKFSRLLNTCDDEDFPITIDTNRLIWAMGSTDTIEYHTTQRRGSRSISLLGAPTPDINLDEMSYHDMTLNITMPKDTTTYWCSFHKGPVLPRKHHIVAFDAVLDNDLALMHTHHYILYNCQVPVGSNFTADQIFGNYTVDWGNNGNECYGPGSSQIPNQYCKEYLFVWAKGGKMMVMPDNVGYPISEADANVQSYYMLELHLDNPERFEGLEFNTGTRFYYTNNLRPIDAGLMTVGHQVDVSLTVPPNTKEFIVSGHCSPTCTEMLPPAGLTIFNALLHSHISGRSLRLRHFRGNIELPYIDRELFYDFDYQQNKHLPESVKILPGDQLTYECTYDSTWKNGMIVSGGMTTTDEMCEAFLWYYPKNNFDQCISNTPLQSHMTAFGVQSYRRTVVDGVPVYEITQPQSMAGLYDDSISFKFNWTSQFQEEYTQNQRFGGHQARCASRKTGENVIVQDQRYPANLVEFVPEDKCASRK